MTQKSMTQIIIGIKGAGELASAIAWRLYQAHFSNIFMLEVDKPLAVRRQVSFCEALYEGFQTVENVSSVKASGASEIKDAWKRGKIPVVIDPEWQLLTELKMDVTVDATLSKRNIATRKNEASLVIGVGPGFCAGEDTHYVIETNRGHHLGRVITEGPAEPNTGIPGTIGGYTVERVLRAPATGQFVSTKDIGTQVRAGDTVGHVGNLDVVAQISGVVRGMIRSDSIVSKGLKLGDIDPRGNLDFCDTISDKARAISGSVLETILRVYNA